MISKTEEHEINRAGKLLLRQAVEALGWVVNDVQEDYAIDSNIQVFDGKAPTGAWFHVQLKSSASSEYSVDGTFISQELSADHARHYALEMRQPIFLIHADVASKKVYWCAPQLDRHLATSRRYKFREFFSSLLGRLLVERAPDSLPALLNLLKDDRKQYVRERVVGLIGQIDAYRFRLRKTELGRSAIDSVKTAVFNGSVKPGCPTCDTPSETWTTLSKRFFEDDFGLNPGTLSAFYAQMLHTLYSEPTVKVVLVGDIRQEWAVPEFTAFITFLTDQDPFFPSWEYTYFGPRNSEVFHPKFAEKMARIEDAWKQYKAGGMAASAE